MRSQCGFIEKVIRVRGVNDEVGGVNEEVDEEL